MSVVLEFEALNFVQENSMIAAKEAPKGPALFSSPTFGAYPHLAILGKLIANAFRALRARVRSNRP